MLRVLDRTTGPVVELGVGLYSTPILHYICQYHEWSGVSDNRHLTSYEDNFTFWKWAKWYEAEHHNVVKVDDWDAIDLTDPCSVALVDHSNQRGRWKDVERLVHAEYVVAHDSEDRNDKLYGYSKVAHLFKHVRRHEGRGPNTTVFSNFHDLKDLW